MEWEPRRARGAARMAVGAGRNGGGVGEIRVRVCGREEGGGRGDAVEGGADVVDRKSTV